MAFVVTLDLFPPFISSHSEKQSEKLLSAEIKEICDTYTHIHTSHILTYIHTYIHTHTYVHTYIRTCIHTYIHTYCKFCREESKHLDKKKGADKPLVVKFYNDPQLRSLRLKHQRSSTVPLPASFSKLPPSIGNISPPSASDVLLLGEGVKTFILTLPDGSGYCR